ncbi:hypothetical protein [Eisenbergiella tayi]|uniref:hypothetical protein n=1 Tax=Eisenbergiella tayi TaxID=1432052 RepID=UPI000848A1A3|nr:hypothetical protein [Eisenbergiella tayi]ODR36271.1 hypothetical protein BEI60_13565 [Eisenbergiella tayi]
MNIQEELRINKKQPVYGFAGTDIGNFYKALIEDCKSHGWTIEQNIYFLMDQAYSYGIIQGKRDERARKKATLISAISSEPSGEMNGTTNEEYRECIGRLLSMISDNRLLKRIYCFVNSLFVKGGACNE